MPTWLQLAYSLQPPRPSWHRSATGGRERMVGSGGRRGVGPPTSRPHPPAHLCTCGRPLHSPGCTHNCCLHGILPGVHRVVHTQAALLSPTPHIQVSSCPPGCPQVPSHPPSVPPSACAVGHALVCAWWAQGQGPLTQLYLTAWPSPALITEAGARTPKALITVAMRGAAAG